MESEGKHQTPYLEIMEQPKQRGFRFRYSCEGPSHGGLPGENSEKHRKTYPTVRLCNYTGNAARVVVSLVTQDDPPRPHAHSLVGRHVVNGQCTVQIGPETNWMASFPNLGILHVTKKNVARVLLERYALALSGPTASQAPVQADEEPSPKKAALGDDPSAAAAALAGLQGEEVVRLREMAEEASRHMNLSVVRLCFQAYLADDSGHFTRALPPCISQPVFDSKAPSASTLKICRMDRHSGTVLGGDEVYLLCDRVQKDDIEVRFFEDDGAGDGGEATITTDSKQWWANGCFAPSDVHRQFAIVFKTPPYYNTGIDRPVNVWIQLRRKSDGEISEAKPFTYQPQVVDTEQLARKRMKRIPHFSDHYGEDGSGGSDGNGPQGGGGTGPMWGAGGSFLPGFGFNANGFPGFGFTSGGSGGSSGGGSGGGGSSGGGQDGAHDCENVEQCAVKSGRGSVNNIDDLREGQPNDDSPQERADSVMMCDQTLENATTTPTSHHHKEIILKACHRMHLMPAFNLALPQDHTVPPARPDTLHLPTADVRVNCTGVELSHFQQVSALDSNTRECTISLPNRQSNILPTEGRAKQCAGLTITPSGHGPTLLCLMQHMKGKEHRVRGRRKRKWLYQKLLKSSREILLKMPQD